MDLISLTSDVVGTCKELKLMAEGVVQMWSYAKELHSAHKEKTLDQEALVNKLWEHKTEMQLTIGLMTQKMGGLHLLVSGAMAAIPHQEAVDNFLQTILDPMLQAQMAGNQANAAADMVTQMLQDVVSHQ